MTYPCQPLQGLAVAVIGFGALTISAGAQTPAQTPPRSNGVMELTVGQSVEFRLPAIQRVLVGNPSYFTVEQKGPDLLLLTPVSPGRTFLVAWTPTERKSVIIQVMPARLSIAPEPGRQPGDLSLERGKAMTVGYEVAFETTRSGSRLSKTTDSFYTFLPLNWKELRDGEISFKRGQGGAEGGTAYSCRINLDLKEFGKLSVMVVMYNKDFFVSFKAERPAFKSLLDEHLEELKGSFVEQGLSLKAVTLDRDNALFGQLEKLESSERIINIKA